MSSRNVTLKHETRFVYHSPPKEMVSSACVSSISAPYTVKQINIWDIDIPIMLINREWPNSLLIRSEHRRFFWTLYAITSHLCLLLKSIDYTHEMTTFCCEKVIICKCGVKRFVVSCDLWCCVFFFFLLCLWVVNYIIFPHIMQVG